MRSRERGRGRYGRDRDVAYAHDIEAVPKGLHRSRPVFYTFAGPNLECQDVLGFPVETAMFRTGDALKRGWELFKENAGLLIGVHLFVFLIHIPQMTTEWVFPGSHVIRGLVVFATVILSYVTAVGLIYIVVTLVDGGTFGFADLFARAHLVFKYLLGSIMYGVIILVGLLLLLVPGIIWGAQFSLWGFYMVEYEMGPIEALKASSRATREHRLALIGFLAVCILLFLVGAVPLLLGWIVVWPVTSLAMAWIYRTLDQEAAPAISA